MKIINKLKNIFNKPTPRKQTVTIKTSKLDFIGKTQTIDILSEQDVTDKINDNNLIINADFEQKLTELKDYSDNQDQQLNQELATAKGELNQNIQDSKQELNQTIRDNKTELQQNINDLKTYSDNEDKKVRQYSDSEDNKIKQSVTTVSNKVNQVETVANRADTKADKATNVANNLKQNVDKNTADIKLLNVGRKVVVFQEQFNYNQLRIDSWQLGRGTTLWPMYVWTQKSPSINIVVFNPRAIYDLLTTTEEQNNNFNLSVRIAPLGGVLIIPNKLNVSIALGLDTTNLTFNKNAQNLSILSAPLMGVSTQNLTTTGFKILIQLLFERIN